MQIGDDEWQAKERRLEQARLETPASRLARAEHLAATMTRRDIHAGTIPFWEGVKTEARKGQIERALKQAQRRIARKKRSVGG